MKKLFFLLFALPFVALAGNVSVKSVTAQQRYPGGGQVDVVVTIHGAAEDVAKADCLFAATNSATKAAIPVEHITRNGEDTGSGSVWTRKFIWDAKADVGEVKIDDVELTVGLRRLGGVQLWESGPYWAECNVGAAKPEEYGYYFWWGDTVGYKRDVRNDGWVSVTDSTGFSFSSDNCPTFCKSNSQLLLAGYIDTTENLAAVHDAATVCWGAPWRMPTDAEFSALINNCTTTWTMCNGVFGRLVTGKGDYASKSIFLPAAGEGYESCLEDLGSFGRYWSSSPGSDGAGYARGICFYSSDFYQSVYCGRCYGRTVRPVRGFSNASVAPGGAAVHIALDCSSLENGQIVVTSVTAQQRYPGGGQVDVVVTLRGAAEDVAAVECLFAATNSATKAAIPVEHIIRNGEDTGSGSVWTRKFIWDAKADVGEVKIDDVELTVDLKPLGGVQLWENGPCWAECNVGATKPEEYGYYFWWGDTVGYKLGGSSWSAVDGSRTGFSFSSGNCPTYDRYSGQLLVDGYIDATGNLVSAHDAAAAHLGAPWRMPTDAEFSALISNCTTMWTTCNGVNGRLVMGKGAYASKSIFLPAAGISDDTHLGVLGSYGFYWTSAPYSGSSNLAGLLCFYSGDFFSNGGRPRYEGLSVRPVRGFSSASVAPGGATVHFALGCGSLENGQIVVSDVTAQKRYPWKGLVDVVVTLQGAAEDVAKADCLFSAKNGATQAEILVKHITRNGEDVESGGVWVRKFVWDAKADVGAVKIDDIALTVGAKMLGGVQLWEDGPYWAECNVGATKPEEGGYYFWWGDTVGYKRNAHNDGWISAKDLSVFSFTDENCHTYGKDNSKLLSEGYVDATGNLVAAHDAATEYLGAPWRMPTNAEISSLKSNCTMTWTTRNGVNGRLVTGKGTYASRSIFLPAVGEGYDFSLYGLGSNGGYWSSTLYSSDSNFAFDLDFSSDNLVLMGWNRSFGRSVRPLRGVADSSAAIGGVTTHLSLDCQAFYRTITFDSQGGNCSLVSKSYENGALIGALPTATRKGCRFLGWFTEASGGVEVTKDLIVDSSRTLYAHWFGIPDVEVFSGYPWQEVVIGYTITGSTNQVQLLEVTAKDNVTGKTYECKTLDGVSLTPGNHVIKWNALADGAKFKSEDVVFTVRIVSPLYCVIDLSGGDSASSYPVTWLIDEPRGGWTEEYKTTKLVLRRIEAGMFTMGHSEEFSNEPHQVKLTNPFYIGVFEITQKQWKLVMGWNDSYFSGSMLPVESVSYDMIRGSSSGAGWPADNAVDATSFLGKLRAKTGIDFDLPTEAQWECACRAGTATIYSYGDSENGEYMWYDGNSWIGTNDVGSFLPNAWGLYDMHGNVWEWCLDWYGSLGAATDPVGASSGSTRVYRGGSWYSYAYSCTSSFRCNYYPSSGYDSIGFRLCRTLQDCRGRTDVECGEGVPVEVSSGPTRVDTTFVDGTKVTSSIDVAYGSVGGLECQVVANGVEIVRSADRGKMSWPLTFAGLNELSYSCGGMVMSSTVSASDCQISFNANGGSTTPATVKKEIGDKYGTLPTVTRRGCEFLGWFTAASGGERITEDTVVDRERTLYAHWFGISDVKVFSGCPWKEVVIGYTITGTLNEVKKLAVTARDEVTGRTYSCHTLEGVDLTPGSHVIKWNASADGVKFKSDNVVFMMKIYSPRYCVIDISSGRYGRYSVAGMDEVPFGGWTDEHKTTKIVLRRIEAGTFKMGDTVHGGESFDVVLTKPFYTGVFEVTQRQWELIMGTRPSCFYSDDDYASRPVEYVSYDMIRGDFIGDGWPANNAVDADSFLGKLRTKTGLEFDLPTEAQWEYACRAGTETDYNNGRNIDEDYDSDLNEPNMDKLGRYYNNGGKDVFYEDVKGSHDRFWAGSSVGTAKVGAYHSNHWGLYDMHGNVWEWCLDRSLNTGAATDPKGADSGVGRVFRGGGWYDGAVECASSFGRGCDGSWKVGMDIGFRLSQTIQGDGDDTFAEASSEPVSVDTTFEDGCVVDVDLPISYGVVGLGNSCAVKVNDEVIVESDQDGRVSWTPDRIGDYVLQWESGGVAMSSRAKLDEYKLLSISSDLQQVDAMVDVSFQLAKGAYEGVLFIDGEAFASTTNKVTHMKWQPLSLGQHVLNFVTGGETATLKVNVVKLSFATPPVPDPPTEPDANIKILPMEWSVVIDGGTSAIATSGSGAWTASASDSWIALNAASGAAGTPIGCRVAASDEIGQRTGYVYVSGHVFTIAQEGHEAEVTPTTVAVEHQGGEGMIEVAPGGHYTWTARPNADWLTILPTSGIDAGMVTYRVAPYNEVATRTGMLTVADKTVTITQIGRRMKLADSAESCDYQIHVIPIVVDALSSTAWSVEAHEPWLSVVDSDSGQNRKGGGQVSVAVAENLSYLPRTAMVTVGTETFTIAQSGRPTAALSFAISPTVFTSSEDGADGVASVSATPDLPWSAASDASWLTIADEHSSGAGNGNVVYSVSPNPTMSARSGMITVTPEAKSGLAAKTHIVTQSAATATVSEERYDFGAAGEPFEVDVAVGDVVNWAIVCDADWVTIDGGLNRVGPGKVKIVTMANPTAEDREAVVTIAGHEFSVFQKGCAVELNQGSVVFGPASEAKPISIDVHTDDNARWTAYVSDPSWLLVWGDERCTVDGNGNVVGVGDATFECVVTAFSDKNSSRTGSIRIGNQTIYITQRGFDLSISPLAVSEPGGEGEGTVGVAAPAGANWEAIATEPWIKVMTTTGSGNGTVAYQFTENLTGKVRTGKIIISGEEYTINQMYRVVMSVGVEGRGSVTGAGNYDYGDDVTLTATPDVDYSFSHWSGAASGTDNPVTIKIDEACKATAHFVPFVPTATATENELDGVTISWGALAWAEQYRVYRAEANQKPESSVATIAKGTLTWKDTTAAPGKTYYYWIEAVGSKEQTTSAAETGVRAVSPTGLAISCVSELFAGQTANCGCTVSYNNGTTKDVTPIWSVVGSGLTVNASGVLTAGTVANDTIATVQASYTESGITKTASAQVTVYPTFDVNDAASGVGTLSMGGSGAWIGQKKESCGGAVALRSTGLASGASAWIGCSVAGAGTLTFKWRKSGTGAGKLALAVNGSESDVCGEASDTWATVTKEFYDSGAKNIRWTYFGGSNVDAHGLVAEIVWTPGTAITVNFNANGGSGTMAGMTFLEGADVALTACAFTRTGYVFAGWATSADGEVAYLDGAAVWGMTAPVGGVVTLYAVWTPNVYTVRFVANGGEGTMTDEPMTYDVTKALTSCVFTRKGYAFAGWATSAGGAVKYANGATVKNLTATAGGTVTLYAKWTPNNYVIDFNPGRGGTGSMSDQPMTYDEEAALYANIFARTGYTFLGWTDDEGELEEVLYYDGVVVSNLTDEVDGEYDLYAVWAANEYTVRFNANGGEGTMAEMGFRYDETQSLPMNAFTRTGYAFAGWAREAATGMSPPQLADAEVVSNLTVEADGVVTLYAVWTANPYTIRFNANGGEGTMTDIGCVYGVERSLTVNAFTRKGYAFAGWATSEKGSVVYADGASVTSLTAEANGVVTLYAVWQAGANAVSFDGNGGTPSETSRSVLTDAQVGALPSATRTGWTLVGWFTAASGGTQVSADTVITAAVTFFAQWTANAYSVKFDANGGSGTMANEPMTYDAAKALTTNAFTKKGYTFAGWATSAGGAVKYANGATVKNLTATAGGTVTLYANWTPNNYVIDFNPGQGGEGTMSDQPMTYDEEMALYANLFARTGYTFLGWTDDESELEEVLFYDGVVVSNLTDEVDGEYDLYAVWAANEYTVKFNANGGKGRMADQAFRYDEEQGLTSNGFTRAGCEFLGWTRDAATGMSLPQLADAEVVSNLTAEADGVVTLYAVWDGTATTWMEDDSFSAAVANTYDGYLIDEDYNLLGVVQVKTTKQTVKKSTDRKTKVVTVTTNITATATVTDANGKKWSYSKGVVTVDGAVTGLKCTTKGCPVGEFGVALGRNGMEGAWGEYVIFGARNGMGVKDDAMKETLEAYKGKWSVTLSCASLTSGQETASPLVVRLQFDVQAKGVVKIAGNWESGAKVSASVQMVMGDGFAYLPVMVKATKTSPALNALLRIDANAAATGMSPPQAVTLLSEGELVAGGRTVEELGESDYLPSEVSAGGKAFSARVAVDELAYPAKFAAKKLPAGLKIDAATGVISGTPTKPGHYVAEVTVTSGLNSKVKKTLTVEFDIANYTDDLIPIEDSYGPYYVGVSAAEQIAAAAGCTASGLPSGLKWTARDIVDTKTKAVKTAANTVYGIPTKACTNTVYFKKTVKETVDGKTKSVTHQASATFIVEGMKPWAYGTFNGGNTNGIVTLTVSNVGKISGKWMSEGLTWTFSAASYAAYYPDEEKYVATVQAKCGKKTKTIEVEVTQEGVIGLSAPVADDRDGTVLFEAWRNGWKEEPQKTLETKLKGQKVTVGENGNIVLTVGAGGAVAAKGTFGSYSASCSTVLIPTAEAGLYRAYLYFPPKSGKFDGFADVVEVSLGDD